MGTRTDFDHDGDQEKRTMFLWYARPTWVNDPVTGAHDSGQVLGLCFVSGMARQPSGPRSEAEADPGVGWTAWIGVTRNLANMTRCHEREAG
jgi:hypothetical protein